LRMGAEERVVLDTARRQGSTSVSRDKANQPQRVEKKAIGAQGSVGKGGSSEGGLGALSGSSQRPPLVTERLQSPRRARTRPNKEVELQEQDECCQKGLRRLRRMGNVSRSNPRSPFIKKQSINLSTTSTYASSQATLQHRKLQTANEMH
jgi:hypothetical protein